MPPSIWRALVAALFGACAGAAAVAALYLARPALVLELDRDLPGYTAGFHPIERAGDTSFAWTTASAALRLRDLDRGRPWLCTVRLQGARPATAPAAVVHVAVDGVTLATLPPPRHYQDTTVVLPARPASRAFTMLTIASEPTFVPGPSDPRELGVQVDRIACRPEAGIVFPPRRAWVAAAMSGAAFGVALALMGLALPIVALATVALAGLQAVPLLSGPAPYGAFPSTVSTLAIWSAGVALAVAKALEWWRREPLHELARAAIGASAILFVLELMALLHPMKPPVDAMFHAHRLEWVLAGNYFFVQPMPDGVGFPYAIGLYVFAAPWAALTADHVSLLRIVVCALNALAALLLYPTIAGTWGDRRAAFTAVVLVHLMPLPFVTLGNANLTFVFGAAVMAVTVATATAWPPHRREVAAFGVLFVVTSLALLSHVGIVALLLATLGLIAVLYRWRGGETLKTRAWVVAIAAALAAVFAFGLYYGRFGEVYQKLGRVGGRSSPPAAATPADRPAVATVDIERFGLSVHRPQRLARASQLAVRAFGWPLVALALLGAWRAIAERRRDRLGLTIVAGVVTGLAFVLTTALTPIEPAFVRYAEEFIDRAYYVLGPIAAILAAHGAMWAWSRHTALRAAAIAALLGAGWIGALAWLKWLS
jgi:hypothetical protein